MPKLDTQGRLTIPLELRSKLSIPYTDELVICYEDRRIFFLNSNSEDVKNEKVLTYRPIDKHGRIFLTNKALEALDATTNDVFIIYLQHDRIYVEALYRRHGRD